MATIKSKIIVNVIILLLTIVGIVVVNYADLCSLRKLQDEGAQRAKDAITLTEASGMADKFYSLVGEAVINRNMPEIEKGWTELRKELRDDAAACEKIADTPKEKELALASHKAFEGLIQLFDTKLLPLLKADIGGARMEELLVIDREIDVLRNTAQKNLQEITGLITKESETADKEFDAQINAAIIKALIIGLIGILLQAGLATWLMRTIMKPVDSLRIMLMDISQGEGDLTKRLDDTTKDELAEISKYFNLFIEKLHRIISQISSTSAQVASASTQLQATAEHIATGAEEVAAQAGTVATAGEEMSATSSDIAQNCQMAADGAQQAAKASREGQQIALKTTEGIKYRIGQTGINAERISKLGERTDQIGAIVGTIEDIADQTNLLALNAAIEAARAGEQGRGFAVVADEVRALAERTTKATKEISDMIRAIQQETKVAVDAMKHGVETSQSAISDSISLETALKQILEKAEDVAMQVNQIATAAEEQTATTSEISNNMMQITEVVHQTSQGAHESATAAAQLNGNADELQRLVHQFKL